MQENTVPTDETRSNNERERGFRTHREAVGNRALPSRDLLFRGNPYEEDSNNEEENSAHENAMASPEESDERLQASFSDIGQPLTDFQFTLGDIARTPQNQGLDSGRENEMDDSQEDDHERLQGRHNRQRHLPPYLQLASDISGPLAELQVQGTNIPDGGASTIAEGDPSSSEDGRNESETGSSRDANLRSTQQATAKKKRRERHYMDIAKEVSGSLAGLRVPEASDDRSLGEQARDFRVGESVTDHHSLLSQPDPHSICSLRDQDCMRETFCSTEEPRHAQQESISEYNPNASCGTCFESCGRSVTQDEQEMRTEHNPGNEVVDAKSTYLNPDPTFGYGDEYETCRQSISQVETSIEEDFGMDHFRREQALQESCSLHDEKASCGSVSYHEEFDIPTDNSLPPPGNLESCSPAMTMTDSSKFTKAPREMVSDFDKCLKDERTMTSGDSYSKPDGEPPAKRSKLNQEATNETSSAFRNRRSDVNTHLNSGMPSGQSTHLESVEREEIQERLLQNNGFYPRERNDESLSSEFEQMNLEGNGSMERRMASCQSIGSHQREEPHESPQTSLSDLETNWFRPTNSSPPMNYIPSQSHVPTFCHSSADDYGKVSEGNISGSRNSSPSAVSKASQKVPEQTKKKMSKHNTNNAYREPAKDVAGDLRANNLQLKKTEVRDQNTEKEHSVAKHRQLCNGNTVQAQEASNSVVDPLETCRRDIQEGTMVTNEEQAKRSSDAVSREMEVNSATNLSGIADSNKFGISQQPARPSSRRKRETPEAAELRRAQIEEQQRSVDNMAPELQALVIEMMQRDEEELGGGHVWYYTNRNPPVPPRLQSQRQGENGHQQATSQRSSQQSSGKKSRKGKKKMGHYVELAGIIAPELAALNSTLTNGHRNEPEHLVQCGNTEISPDVGNQGAVGHSQRVFDRGVSTAKTSGSHSIDVSLQDQFVCEMSSDDQSHRQPRAHPATNQKQKRGNANHKHGTGPDAASRGLGKENRGQSRRGKKSKEDDVSKSLCSQMAENIASSLQTLNVRLEEHQQRSASVDDAANSEDSVTRDSSDMMDSSENGFK